MYKLLLFTVALTLGSCCSQRGGQTPQATIPAETTSAISGGYTAQRPLTEQDRALFLRVTAELDGASYAPQSVATQVVAGMNYKYICTGRTTTRNPETFEAEVTVFVPLPCNGGEPRISGIRRLKE